MILKLLGNFVNTLIDRIVSVTGAVVFCQIPQLIVQYKRVLEGALAESAKNIGIAKSKAAEIGLSLREFIDAHLRNPDSIFQKSGEVYQQALERNEEYKNALVAINDASIWNRFFIFLKHLDSDLFFAMNFEPGIPLNAEGAIYALAGILFALGFYHGVIKIFSRLFLNKNKNAKKDIS